MDDELKRKIAASLDRPKDAAADPDVVRALERDPQAKAFARGLSVIDDALRRWPTAARSTTDWEKFASGIERRLGESPAALGWDVTERPPLRDDHTDDSESKPMAQSHDDNNDDDDLEGLAALTRTSSGPSGQMSVPPPPVAPGPSLTDDKMDESSGIVDIKQLAEIALRQAAPPPSSALAPVPADETGRSDAAVMAGEKPTAKAKDAPAKPANAKAGAAASSEAKATPAPSARPAVPAQPQAAKGGSNVVWIGGLLAVAAAGVFLFMRSQGNERSPSNEERAAESAPPSTTATAPAPVGAPATATPPAEPAAPPVVAANPAPQANAPAPGAVPETAPTTPATAQAAPAAPAVVAPPAAAEHQPASANAAIAQADRPATGAGADHEGAATVARADHPTDRRNRSGETLAMNTERPTTETRSAGAPHHAAEPAPTPAAAPPPPPATHAAASTTTAAPAGSSASGHGTAGGGTRSIDDLMAQATGGHGGVALGGAQSNPSHASAPSSGGGSAGAAPAPAAAAGPLADRPSRAQVTATMTRLSAAVRACTQGQTGTATVAMMVRANGSVMSASVSGPFSGDATSCIRGVAMGAQFPPFTRPQVPIVYPFSIQPRSVGQSQ